MMRTNMTWAGKMMEVHEKEKTGGGKRTWKKKVKERKWKKGWKDKEVDG